MRDTSAAGGAAELDLSMPPRDCADEGSVTASAALLEPAGMLLTNSMAPSRGGAEATWDGAYGACAAACDEATDTTPDVPADDVPADVPADIPRTMGQLGPLTPRAVLGLIPSVARDDAPAGDGVDVGRCVRGRSHRPYAAAAAAASMVCCTRAYATATRGDHTTLLAGRC